MNKNEFLDYIRDNFSLSGAEDRLIENIVNYIACQGLDEEEQYSMACALLDGTIGLSDAELRKIDFN